MSVGVLEGLTETLGEELTEVAGYLSTRLVAQLQPEIAIQNDINNADGTAGEGAISLAVSCTWDGTTTVVCSDTTGVVLGKFIRLDSDGQVFEVVGITPNVDITISNPAGLAIPAGTGPTTQLVPTIVILSSGGFLPDVASGMRLRLTSGLPIGDSGLINSRDSSVRVTLRTALSVPPASFTGLSWQVVVDAETVAQVESTSGWKSSGGKFFLDGVLYRYSGKTLFSFTGLEHFDGAFFVSGAKQLHEPLSVLADYTQEFSALDLYRRSCMVAFATGSDLNTVGQNVGVLRPPELGDDDLYRALIQATAYAPRGTIYSLELALDALLGELLIQESADNVASASGTVVTIVAGQWDPAIEKGMRFRIKTDGELLDETVLIEERISNTQIRLQSDRLGDFNRLRWEVARKNWEIFEDLTSRSANHGAQVFIANLTQEGLASIDSEGRAFLEDVEAKPSTASNQITVSDPFLRVSSVTLADEGCGECIVAQGTLATSADNGQTITGPASTFPTSIKKGDRFVLLDSVYAGATAIIQQRVSDLQLILGLVDSMPNITSSDDGRLGINFTGASWQVIRDKTNARFYKPSTETRIEYDGDPGTTIWAFAGAGSEAINSVVGTIAGRGEVLQLTDFGAATPVYKHTARITPESDAAFELYWDHNDALGSGATDGLQMAMVLSDGVRTVLVGVIDDGTGSQDVGFIDETGGFIGVTAKWSGVSGSTFTPGLNAIRITKNGTHSVQLWKEAFDGPVGDGFQLIDEILYSALPTVGAWQTVAPYTAGAREIAFGLMKSIGGVELFIKHADWSIKHPHKDFWNTEFPNALLLGNQLTDDAMAGLMSSGDVGKFVRITEWGALNSSDGNPRGEWEIDSVIDGNNATIRGPTKKNGTFTLVDLSRFIVRDIPDAFRWPDHRGHSVEILTGANAGIYPILEILDPISGANVEAAIPAMAGLSMTWTEASKVLLELHSNTVLLDTAGGVPARPLGFVPVEEDADWRLVPNFVTDSDIQFELVDSGTDLGSGILQTRTTLPFPVGTVFAVAGSRVLTGQLLDAKDANDEPTPGQFLNYPFYLFDNFRFVRTIVDLLTAAGVIAEFELLYIDQTGPHILG